MNKLKLWSTILLIMMVMPIMNSCGGDDDNDSSVNQSPIQTERDKFVGVWCENASNHVFLFLNDGTCADFFSGVGFGWMKFNRNGAWEYNSAEKKLSTTLSGSSWIIEILKENTWSGKNGLYTEGFNRATYCYLLGGFLWNNHGSGEDEFSLGSMGGLGAKTMPSDTEIDYHSNENDPYSCQGLYSEDNKVCDYFNSQIIDKTMKVNNVNLLGHSLQGDITQIYKLENGKQIIAFKGTISLTEITNEASCNLQITGFADPDKAYKSYRKYSLSVKASEIMH